ncbi:glycerophosphoryl diester phosphodiesterase [Actinomadura pelletieri DSM 43383]|uniref:Glycerophosphoryl diester phosphodiesterase n=1 Tax=Actinomadura pelletieri DSM 43383 TaxID=1120940 RepID=A0A495Q9E6_9ACTN|nr:glycerophosphodiester phosphodiesterase family protein [Actinomadura pelletieri]RKS68125.1 glycerophosphoryl diester phosphodiesterase [Actinomadura pelletieri DSM 43383]
MHRRNRFVLLVLTASLILPVPSAAAEVVPVSVRLASGKARVANVAHRGASAYAPENTIAAFKLAVSQRADVVEVDVQESKDHELVLMHDTTLARTTNVEEMYPKRAPWEVSDFTLAEIRRLDAGAWFGKKYRGERVPTLGQTLSALEGRGVGLLVEIKSPRLYPGIEKRVAGALRRSPSWLRNERRLAVQSFDWRSMRRFHSVLPQVPIGLLGTPKAEELPWFASYADEINPPWRGLSAAYVKQVHAARMDVLTWTINNSGDMRRAIRLGVDGIITNKPDVLNRVLKETAAPGSAA